MTSSADAEAIEKRIAKDPDDPLGSFLFEDPDLAEIEIDREIVAQHGLSAFLQLAWQTVEGDEKNFTSGWHIDAICEHLMGVSAGHILRLGIMVPPRHSKSLLAAVMYPAWDWIKYPWRRFLFASFAHRLAIRDSVKCRRIIQSAWYQQRWGGNFILTSDQNTKIKFENDKTGYRICTSVDGQVTGDGGDTIIVDDPHSVKKADSETVRESALTWWDESMQTRLNNQKTGAFVLIQQRVHERDLMGHILAKQDEDWTILCLPAEFEPDHPQRWFRDPRKEVGELLWPERIGPVQIARLKASLGPYAASAQLQQRPSPREGGLFKRNLFPIVRVLPDDLVMVRGWDTAGTERKLIKSDPDYTAGVKVGWSRSAACWFIVDVRRDRMEAHDVEKWLLATAVEDGIQVQIQLAQDPGSGGKAFAQTLLRLLSRFSAFADPVNGDKMSRALTWAGKAGQGLVKLHEAPWNRVFLEEITSFPTGAHDDMVDATSSAFDRLLNNTLGIVGFYEQELAARGIKASDLLAPHEIAERAAAPPLDPEALAKALLG